MNRSDFLKSVGLAAAVSIAQPMDVFARTSVFTTAPDFLFKEGDQVMFLGDSITHSGRWQTFIRNFYLTCYPERRISYINSGVTGDSTGSVLARMDDDVLQHRPTVVVILLGMNNTSTSPDIFDQQMNEIVEKLSKHCSPKFIYCTTTIYDETAELERVPQIGKNEALAKLSELIRKRAKKSNSLLVEFYQPMMQLNAKMQKNDPTYTIIGPDRVHPLLDGHLLMAYYFIKAQHADEKYSENVLNWSPSSFSITETMLPYPIPSYIKSVETWVPLKNELNRQLLKVNHVPEGNYQLFIDQTAVGSFSNLALKSGINLGILSQSPPYQQALAIYDVTSSIADKAARMRTLLKVKQMLKRDKIDQRDSAALEAYKIKQAKVLPFYGTIIGTYIENRDKEAQILQEISDLEKSLLPLREIKAHQYLLKKINT
jgi:lysophospholipase L1-like esterase